MATNTEGAKGPVPEISQEVRIVLLGKTGVGKSISGNIILGRKAFLTSETHLSPQTCERHNGIVAGRRLAVINTPDLFSTKLSQEKRSQEIKRCMTLSAPGPHVFLLVQQMGGLSQEQNALEQCFGEGTLRYTMVLFINGDEENYMSISKSPVEAHSTLHDFTQGCGGWCHLHSNRDNTQVVELLEKIDRMLEGNGGKHFTCEIFKESEVASTQEWERTAKEFMPRDQPRAGDKETLKRTFSILTPEVSVKKEFLEKVKMERIRRQELQRSKSSADKKDKRKQVRMVLVGKTGVGKSATGNTILGREAFVSTARMMSVTKTCQRETGEVAGNQITVVDTPGLFDTTLSNEDIQHEIMKCMALSAPGPHVFLVVISVGRFTQQERETLKLIKMTFGDKAGKYTIVVFTRGDDLGNESIKQYIEEGDPEVWNLIHDCGGRYHVLNNKERSDKTQVVDLLRKIDKLYWENEGSWYTSEMFLEAEAAMIEIQVRKEKEEELQKELEKMRAKYESEMRNMMKMKDEERKQLERKRMHQLREKEAFTQREKHEQKKTFLEEQFENEKEASDGAAGTWKECNKKDREDEEGKESRKQQGECEHDDEGRGKGLKKQKRKHKNMFQRKFKMHFKGREKQKTEKKKEDKNTNQGESQEKKKNTKKDVDKQDREADKMTHNIKGTKKETQGSREEEIAANEETTEQGVRQSLDLESPDVDHGDSEKDRQEEGGKQEYEAKKVEEICKEMEECKIRIEEIMRKFEDIAQKQNEDLKHFTMKYANHVEPFKKRQGMSCVIQ